MKNSIRDCGTQSTTASWYSLSLRLWLGLMMLLGHGIAKWQNFDKINGNFHRIELFHYTPFTSPISLMLSIGTEVGCSILLILGWWTRPAAFLLAFSMIVAAFDYHANHPTFSNAGPSKELALMYLIPYALLLLNGAGKFSLDHRYCLTRRKRH